MATKPKDIDWEALNTLKNELVGWLDARNLIGPDDDEFTLALKLLAKPKRHQPVVFEVARALYEIEIFRAASVRASRENIIPKDAPLTEDERKAVILVTDDSADREVDRAIRGLLAKVAHIERRIAEVAGLQVKRAEAQRMVPDQKEIDALHELTLKSLIKVALNARQLHRAFRLLSPSMDLEPLSLAGGEQVVKRLRSQLAEAGYPGG